MHTYNVGGGKVNFLQEYGPKSSLKQTQSEYLKYLSNFSAIVLKRATFWKHFISVASPSWRKGKRERWGMSPILSSMETAAGSAFQVSFRFGGDSLGLKMLKRFLLLRERWGFPATPELWAAGHWIWPAALIMSLFEAKMILWFSLGGSGSECHSLTWQRKVIFLQWCGMKSQD